MKKIIITMPRLAQGMNAFGELMETLTRKDFASQVIVLKTMRMSVSICLS